MRNRARRTGKAGLALALALAAAGAPATGSALPATAGPAASDPAALCERAAAVASAESGVPPDVLLAVMLTESGRARAGRLRPWPWTVNAAGKGYFFPDRAAAEAFAAARLSEGAPVFDAGCAQVNYRWHGAGFADAAAMFDPLANARYAAGFLARLHAEFGSWEGAAGAYHSRTPALAAAYRTRFAAHRARLGPATAEAGAPTPAALPAAPPASVVPPAPAPRANPFPLLRAGAPGAPGSLVPASAAVPAPFFRAAGALLP